MKTIDSVCFHCETGTYTNSCELCSFKNPKSTVTAIILKENRLLMLKRNEEPFKGVWDLVGGYMNAEETPEEAMKREIKEELGVEPKEMTFMGTETGSGFWKDQEFPILSHFYLVDIDQPIKLNDENSDFTWFPLKDLDFGRCAWDSNRNFLARLKARFTFDLERIRELVKQLDSNAEVKEQSLYKAVIGGKIETIYDKGRLVAMGWAFPRQTLLRHQAVVEDMIVDEAYRGQGYGRFILTGIIEWAKDRGIEVLELTTNPKRIAANELYKSEGFKLHETNHYLLNLT